MQLKSLSTFVTLAVPYVTSDILTVNQSCLPFYCSGENSVAFGICMSDAMDTICTNVNHMTDHGCNAKNHIPFSVNAASDTESDLLTGWPLGRTLDLSGLDR